MRVCRFPLLALVGLVLACAPGCILGSRPTLVQVGTRDDQRTFYLDGAGNYGFGKESVPLGLADGGYEGHVEHYIWTTYLGAIVDQVSVSHNRREGYKLAARIREFLDIRPHGEVNLIGLSAGTGIIVFALEALDPKYRVQNVVMLSSSLSADYDLTAALRRVDGGIYFFWSPDDPILAELVPLVGTVDRSSRSNSPAGIWGARMPFGASQSTRDLYARKVHNIRWYPEPLIGPLKLRHAGSISRSHIRDLVAPILVYRSRAAMGAERQTAAPAPKARPAAAAARASSPLEPRPRAQTPQPASGGLALITVGDPTTAPASHPARRVP